MENIPPRNAASPAAADDTPDPPPPQSLGRKRSGSGGSILSKFPFMRTSSTQEAKLQQQGLSPRQPADSPKDAAQAVRTSPRALAAAISQQQHSGRRRKGSLRKVALLGRGAARDRREREAEAASGIAAATTASNDSQAQPLHTQDAITVTKSAATTSPVHGLGITGISSTPLASSVASSDNNSPHDGTPTILTTEPQLPSPSRSPTYTTTDDEDILVMPSRDQSPAHLSKTSLTSMSDAFFAKHSSSTSIQRRRSNRGTATSPLSLQGLTTSPLPQTIEDHDYSETEWWGWVILIVTWFVFVIGMGSCLNIWSWAWDVGTTPYAPPELEDDPTLPIVGYYPALMILTTIMAWVWVITAWVGMKYFRHAKMTGD